jgi:hypothetical protein
MQLVAIYNALITHQSLIRYDRHHRIDGPDVYSGADRHNGEIVGFYLSLLLGMRRTPVAIGRMINLTSEILANADRDLAATFFKNSTSKITQAYLFLVLREN